PCTDCPSCPVRRIQDPERECDRISAEPWGQRDGMAGALLALIHGVGFAARSARMARGTRLQLRLPQKRWIRRQASSRCSVAVAYEIRKAGPEPNAEPCTTATPSFSRSSVTKSSSVSSFLPDGAVLPIVPGHDG